METKFVKKNLLDLGEDITKPPTALDELAARICEAKYEASREGIKVNTIIINENMVKIKPFIVEDPFGSKLLTPPMFCGLNTYFTADELPDGYSFAVFEGRHPDKPGLDICGAIDYIYERTYIDQNVLQRVLELTKEYMEV